MKTKNINIIGILVLLLSLAGCIKDGETLCPEEKVRFHFFAEKFQNQSQNALDDREDKFCDRIQYIKYYLYKDNILKEERTIDKFEDISSNCFTVEYTSLEPGKYELVAIGNSTKNALSGDPEQSANLVLTYPGCDNTEDFFYTVFPFTVRPGEVKEYEVGLYRAHGVIRYIFVNMPEDVSDIGVTMKNVGNEKWITGDFKNAVDASRRYTVSNTITRQSGETNQDYVIGTFPTPTDQYSTFNLSLYRNGNDQPYISQMIADTLKVVRNQLIEITTTFSDDGINFEINLDNKWDGSHLGGIGEVK